MLPPGACRFLASLRPDDGVRADRFVMGLLRACADMVLIGAGTLRATPGHLWISAHVCPAAADGYAALRRSRGMSIDPLLTVVTARGDLPAGHPALRAGALFLTTAAGARRLTGPIQGRLDLPACCVHAVPLQGNCRLPA